MASKAPPIDKRRQILDAAVRVFARQGFHSTRVADIADEAGVAYGLVYHYFKSKDEVLNELFSERWSLLLTAIEEADRSEATPRAKLEAVAGFIVDSYRHDPELMKVIIVEVTRAAKSFGAAHRDTISDAYRQIQGIVEKAQASGEFRATVTAQFAAMAFYGAIEQVLTGWIFGLLVGDDLGHGVVGAADLRQVGAPEGVGGAGHLDDDHLHQLGVVAVGVDAERGDRGQLVAGRLPRPVGLLDRAQQQRPALDEELVQDLVLGAEVVIDEPVGDAGLVGDVGDPGRVEALAGEDADRGVEDLAALVDRRCLRHQARASVSCGQT